MERVTPDSREELLADLGRAMEGAAIEFVDDSGKKLLAKNPDLSEFLVFLRGDHDVIAATQRLASLEFDRAHTTLAKNDEGDTPILTDDLKEKTRENHRAQVPIIRLLAKMRVYTFEALAKHTGANLLDQAKSLEVKQFGPSALSVLRTYVNGKGFTLADDE